MKKVWSFILIFIITLGIVGCEKEKKEEINLYPAYKLENNIKKWGFIDSEGTFKIDAKYETVKDFKDGYSLVEKDGLFGVIDSEGEKVLEIKYDNIREYDSGFWITFKDDNITLINEDYEKINLGEQYSNIGSFGDGYFSVMTLDNKGEPKFGYIDVNGEKVIDFQYDLAYNFVSGKAIVQKDERYYLIDKMGKTFKELEYKNIRPFKSGDIYIYNDSEGNHGLLDNDGKILIPAKYSAIVDYEDNLIVYGEVKDEKELLGLMDKAGNEKLESKYNDIKILGKGYVAVSDEIGVLGKNMYEILDEKLEPISDIKYYNVGGANGKIENELISVCDDSKTFLIDLSGNVSDIIEPEIGWGEMWTDGKVIKTRVDEDLLYYDLEGTIIWEADETYRINDKIQILKNEEVADAGVNIKYPRIIGLENKEVQEEINEFLLNEFIRKINLVDEDDNRRYEYYKVTYEVNNLGSILQIKKKSRFLFKKIMEEQIVINSYNIDLETGELFVLDDILIEDSDAIGELNEIIEKNLESSMEIDLKQINKLTRGSEFYYDYKEDAITFKLSFNSESFMGYPKTVTILIEEIKELIDFNSIYFEKTNKEVKE